MNNFTDLQMNPYWNRGTDILLILYLVVIVPLFSIAFIKYTLLIYLIWINTLLCSVISDANSF